MNRYRCVNCEETFVESRYGICEENCAGAKCVECDQEISLGDKSADNALLCLPCSNERAGEYDITVTQVEHECRGCDNTFITSISIKRDFCDSCRQTLLDFGCINCKSSVSFVNENGWCRDCSESIVDRHYASTKFEPHITCNYCSSNLHKVEALMCDHCLTDK